MYSAIDAFAAVLPLRKLWVHRVVITDNTLLCCRCLGSYFTRRALAAVSAPCSHPLAGRSVYARNPTGAKRQGGGPDRGGVATGRVCAIPNQKPSESGVEIWDRTVWVCSSDCSTGTVPPSFHRGLPLHQRCISKSSSPLDQTVEQRIISARTYLRRAPQVAARVTAAVADVVESP